MLIDAHHHLWDTAKADYPWLVPDLGPIFRDFEFAELLPQLEDAGIGRTVLVQASDNPQDTQHMLSVAKQNEQIAGVVGWIPLDRTVEAAKQLETLRENPVFCGVRPGIHFMPDPDWLLSSEVAEGLVMLEELSVPLDIVGVRRRHLEIVPELSRRFPELRMVLDHLCKPPIGKPEWFAQWRDGITAASENPMVFAKLSGMFPARGDMTAWDSETIRPFVDVALEQFGADRLMFGSDWPISILAGGFEKVWREFNAVIADVSKTERNRILGGSAIEFYSLEVPQEDGVVE